MDNAQNNNRHFVYFYFNRNEPEEIRHIVPAHVEYWNSANLQGYMGGPFADRSGGVITFVASTLEDAMATIEQDPFTLKDLIAERWIKEWLID